ncbi:class I adenylate-forming enzyme family protein [Nocardioides campestrisoli]|uniref:class I adenylate-forming enzyme family protein n=1 Tax=Nocardioides campestrisoli TaxID=2736757 RepID=UPI00163D80D4|nr:AMP-binding protein [Nocardioides campestrisoli]
MIPRVDLPFVPCPLPGGGEMATLADVLRGRAALTPDLVAVRTDEGVTTFGELDVTASRIAQGLAAAGVGPGSRVAVLGPNDPETLVTVHGVARSGAVPVVVNHLLVGRELAEVLVDCEPAAVLLGGHDQSALDRLELPASVRLVVGRAEGGERVPVPVWAQRFPAEDPGHALPAEETALMLYTSGTTGLPKGIELTGHNLSAQYSAILLANDMGEGSVAMAPLPFFHIAGLGYAVLATLRGAELVMVQPGPGQGIADLWEEFSVTHAVVVPALLQMLVRDPAVRARSWPHLAYLTYGASAMTVELLQEARKVFGCRFLQGYGLTETTGGVSMLSPEDHDQGELHPWRLATVGRAIPGSAVAVVDPITLEELPAGQDGEILVAGHQVMKGYWRNPQATERAMTPTGWFRTGDVGCFDDDGYLTIRDRIKDMIISGGENVYPAEVERVLAMVPGVLESAVVGIASDRWGESPYAFVVHAEGVELTEEAVLAHCRANLAPFKVPVGVTFAGALPKNATGKIRKHQLRS